MKNLTRLTGSTLPCVGALCFLSLLFGGCAVTGQEVETPLQAMEQNPHVLMHTSMGDMLLELDRNHAPISVDNFLHYVRDKNYDGTIFHRVIAGFVIQGGGFDTYDKERPTRAPIKLEAGNGLSNLRGTIAMAREEAPNSATDEFYINLVDNRKLDPHPEIPGREFGYAVFGRVIEGMEVADRIATTPTGAVGPFQQDAPLASVLLMKVVRLPPST